MRYSCLAPLVLSALVAACVQQPPAPPPQSAPCAQCQPAPQSAKAAPDDGSRSADDALCQAYLPDGYAQCRARLERDRIMEILKQLHPKT